MKIVVDTNVLISGVFFGGSPGSVLCAIVESKVDAFATDEIIQEYYEIIDEMISRKQGSLDRSILTPLIDCIEIVEAKTYVSVSRDSDDDKFIGCAKDADAMYIVSGDKDLLVLERYENIEIITAKEFCDRYL